MVPNFTIIEDDFDLNSGRQTFQSQSTSPYDSLSNVNTGMDWNSQYSSSSPSFNSQYQNQNHYEWGGRNYYDQGQGQGQGQYEITQNKYQIRPEREMEVERNPLHSINSSSPFFTPTISSYSQYSSLLNNTDGPKLYKSYEDMINEDRRKSSIAGSPVPLYDTRNFPQQVNITMEPKYTEEIRENARLGDKEYYSQYTPSSVITSASSSDNITCKDAINHIHSCEICNSYLNSDRKILYLIIGFLFIIILYLLFIIRSNKRR